MPRDIPVGNGRLLVNFDGRYQIRDVYFPSPGRENHSQGEPFRFGVWVDGQFSWISSADWSRRLRYLPQTLVTQVELRSARLGLELISNDAVDFFEDVFLRRLVVRDLAGRPRVVRLFFHHDFHIGETENYDTAYYDPNTQAVIHYEHDRYFLARCLTDEGMPFDQWATGRKKFKGAEGTWRDAEDGHLQGNPIAQGSVDSTIGATLVLPPDGERHIAYWMGAGRSHRDVRIINDVVLDKTPEKLIKRTEDYWRAWVNKESMNLGDLPPEVARAFKRGLLTIRTNIAENGAIIAATDGDVKEYSRDTYSYMWPRDGALTGYALDIAGFSALTTRFYSFIKGLITPDGYFLHKYTPGGSPGSSWHPWVQSGEPQLPIQEDETALVLWGLWKHYNKHRIIEFAAELYRPVIKLAADFLVQYRDPETGLPLPSWDLWEERRGVHTFTVATVWAGLQAAARFADLFGEQELVSRYVKAAGEVKEALVRYLYLPQLGRFARTLNVNSNPPSQQYDLTVDASLFAVWYFGVLEPGDPMVRSSMQSIRETLSVKTEVGGIARYERDGYYRVVDDVETVPGNPWFICTLWLAQYEIALARTVEELMEARKGIEWVVQRSLESGILAEQVHPFTAEPLSVSPLTWSHSQLVTAVIEYLERLHDLSVCESCGQAVTDYTRRDTGAVPARLTEFPAVSSTEG